jgi:hypothetical protein
MNDDASAMDLRGGIARWQQKYGIADGDPVLACLELFDLYVSSLRQRPPDSPPPRFEEFRSTIELLDARGRGFAKHAAELTHELRQAAQAHRQFRRAGLLSVALGTLAGFGAGILAGTHLW